jgi:hypothetical protein
MGPLFTGFGQPVMQQKKKPNPNWSNYQLPDLKAL